MNEQLLTFEVAASVVGPEVKPTVLHRWRERGLLKAMKVGRQWRTTEAAVREAVEKQWQSSCSMGQIGVSEPNPKRECDVTSGISNGTRDDGAKSVALAASLATDLVRKGRSAHSSSRGIGQLQVAHVIPLKSE